MIKDLKNLVTSALILGALSAGALAIDSPSPTFEQKEPPPKNQKVFVKKDKEPKNDQPNDQRRNNDQQRERDEKKLKPPGS